MKAIQLSLYKELEIDYYVLQEKQKHLLAKKRRAGGKIWGTEDRLHKHKQIQTNKSRGDFMKFIIKLIIKLAIFAGIIALVGTFIKSLI